MNTVLPTPSNINQGACTLPQWGVISASGPDARLFLHGQLSQDLLSLQPNEGRFAAYCNPQGRMLASMYVLAPDSDQVLLVCHHSVLQACLKRLRMFVLRAKLQLQDASAQWQVCGGIALPSQNSPSPWSYWQENKTHCLALYPAPSYARTLMLAPVVQTLALKPELLALWDWLAVQSGVAHISTASAGQYLPQMLNYESVGGVSFKKGCYPGQEIVARSQFRGQVKRRAYLLSSSIDLNVGDEIFADTHGQDAVGVVVQSAANPQSNLAEGINGGATIGSDSGVTSAFAAIACLQNTAASQSALYAEAGVSVHPAPVPYSLLQDI